MITLKGTLHQELTAMIPGSLKVSFFAEATLRGLHLAQVYYVDQVLKDKFASYAPAKYGFARRSPDYDKAKVNREMMKDPFMKFMRPVVKPQPQYFVKFGDLKAELLGRPPAGFNTDYVADDFRTEMTVRVRIGHPMRGAQWDELKRILPYQARAMADIVVKEVRGDLTGLLSMAS